MLRKQIIILVVVAIVFGGVGFFSGMKYSQSKTLFAGMAGQRGQMFAQGQGGLRGTAGVRNGSNNQFVNGEVLSKDSSSLTVKLQNGSSKIVFYSGSTNIGKTTNGTAADITVGEQVMVSGTANSDGSVTAQNVQIRNASSTPQGMPLGR